MRWAIPGQVSSEAVSSVCSVETILQQKTIAKHATVVKECVEQIMKCFGCVKSPELGYLQLMTLRNRLQEFCYC